MSDSESRLDTLQRRLDAALDRIGRGVEAMAPPEPATPQADPAEVEALRQALEEERLANGQLQERVSALRARQATALGEAEKALADQKTAMARLDQDLQRVRMANDQLRDSNKALREANQAGVGEADLVNRSLQAELEALRAAHAADRSEAAAIVAALTPLIANGAGAQVEGEG